MNSDTIPLLSIAPPPKQKKKFFSYSIEIETLEIYKLEGDDATHVIGKHFKSFTDPGSSTTTPASTRTVSPTLTDFRYQARHHIIRHTIYLVVNVRSKIFSHYLVTIRRITVLTSIPVSTSAATSIEKQHNAWHVSCHSKTAAVDPSLDCIRTST